MKKLLKIISVIFIISRLFTVNAFAAETHIDDMANLFSESEEAEINSAITDYSVNTDYSFVIVTTDNAEGKSSQLFADDYYDNLILSEGWQENGLLFLIDMDNREIYILTSGECINVYSDYIIEEIIDSGYDELVNGNYSECILMMIDSATGLYTNFGEDDYSNYYDDEYVDDEQYDDDYYYVDDYNYEDNLYGIANNMQNYSLSIVIAAVIAVIAVITVKNQYKNMGKGDEFNTEDVILNLTGSNDTVISRNVITTRIPRNNNHNKPGGRTGGGGSSVHRSSGGFSRGGGGRKF